MKNNFNRRSFIDTSLKAAITLPLIGSSLFSCTSPDAESTSADTPPKPLNILLLGGTSFLGPHQIAYALSRGHSITTFTRGKSKPTVHQDLMDKVTQLIGDREDDLTALENGTWDVVIDNSGRKVEWTKKTAALLKDRVGLYLYTSSTGVYYPYLGDDIKEDTKVVLKLPDNLDNEDMKYEYDFGIMKANSELAAKKEFGEDRTLIVRPTYMIGPGDRFDRFIYWPVQLSRGGDVFVPGKSDDPVQYIDVRDVAQFMIHLIEQKMTGTYNAVGPKEKQTIHEFAKEGQQAFDVASNLVFVDDYDFLKTNNLPYLIPWVISENDHYGTARVNNDKSKAAGLTFSPIKTTLQDTIAWWNSGAISEERKEKFENGEASILNHTKEMIAEWTAVESD